MTLFNAFSSCSSTSGAAELRENDSPTTRALQYAFDPAIDAAVDVAIGLGRPLLVAGEPGCGKTELGYAIARRMKIDTLYFFAVKSSSEAGDLFYTYDAVGRFRKAQLAAVEAQSMRDKGLAYVEPQVGDFIKYQALGRAILDAHPAAKVGHLLKGANHRPPPPAPRRSVVVIDEIDKAPRDFTNDLLREIEDLSFRVPELLELEGKSDATPAGAEIRPEHRPIIIVTSNEESQLPDAFLRRCVFLALEFPKDNRLTEILDLHFGDGADGGRLKPEERQILVTVFQSLRTNSLQKPPGVAELIDAGRVLQARPAAFGLRDWLPRMGPALIKLKADRAQFQAALGAVRLPATA